MTSLRHAGTVTAPEQLGRAREDAILLWVGIHVRTATKRMQCRHSGTHAQNLAEARKALRLDDPVLDDLIARRTGPIQWSEDRARETA